MKVYIGCHCALYNGVLSECGVFLRRPGSPSVPLVSLHIVGIVTLRTRFLPRLPQYIILRLASGHIGHNATNPAPSTILALATPPYQQSAGGQCGTAGLLSTRQGPAFGATGKRKPFIGAYSSRNRNRLKPAPFSRRYISGPVGTWSAVINKEVACGICLET